MVKKTYLYLRHRSLVVICGAILLCIGVLSVFVWRGQGFRFLNKDAVQTCKDCNIVLIDIDPLRADGLHSFGNPRSVSPTLDAVAQKSFTFTAAYAVSSWTLPSAMSLFTSTYPLVHHIINKDLVGATENEGTRSARLSVESPHIVTLATVLKNAGYVTGGFAGGAALDPSFGFSKGFDEYKSPGDFEGIPTSVPSAIDFAKTHKDDKVFLFLHGFDTHGQYTPAGGLTKEFVDPKYAGNLTGSTEEQKALREEGVVNGSILLSHADVSFLRAIYDEKVKKADAEVASFLTQLASVHMSHPTILIFTSDHGDEFYEHGRIDHGMTLYDEVLHVPLIISMPGQSKGVTVSDQVRNIDIMPTVLALAGILPDKQIIDQMEGVSLLPTMNGDHQKLNLFAETSYRYATFLQSVRTWDGWKLIYDEQSILLNHLYDVNTDKTELKDLTNTGNPKESQLMSLLSDMVVRIRLDDARLHK